MTERVRNSIPISGINTAIPSHVVSDGAMEDMLNLRYKNEAFVNVCEPKVISSISDYNGFRIMHHMEALEPDEYIAVKGMEIHHVVVENEIVVSKALICEVSSTKELKMSHFGSMLYVNYVHSDELKEQTFIYKDEKFVMFNLADIEPPEIEVISTTVYSGNNGMASPEFCDERESTILKLNMRGTPIGTNYIGTETYHYNIACDKLQGQGAIVGDFYIMVAYKLFDGSIIKPSKPIRVSSFEGHDSEGFIRRTSYWENNNDTFEIYYVDVINGVKPTIYISASPVNNDIVKGLVVLSTRPEIIFDYDDIYNRLSGLVGKITQSPLPPFQRWERLTVHRGCIVDKPRILYDQPYYEIADIEITSIDKDIFEYPLVYNEHYKDIEHKIAFKPSFSHHSVASGYKFEYNNRLHMTDIWLRLFQGYSFSAPLDPGKNELLKPSDFGAQYKFAPTGMTINISAELTIERENYSVHRSALPSYMLEDADGNIYAAVCNFICYPDARATKIHLSGVYGNGTHELSKSFTLKKSLYNNTAYAYVDEIDTSRDSIPTYSLIKLSSVSTPNLTDQTPKATAVIRQRNKIQVSALNNPFFIDPANIYSVGSEYETITDINTATEQITETKFGVFPLYVFSNKAIHALEVGSGEVLYSRVIGVSNDAKLPSTGTVGAANLMFYISERGVMALEGRSAVCISTPLESCAGGDMGATFRLYCAKGMLSYNPIESELMLYNDDYDYAYIYSLEGRFWGRREWNGTPISGSNRQLIIPGIGVASAWHEDRYKPASTCSLISRPIKLSSLEFKRMETLIARSSFGDKTLFELYVDGSNNLDIWNTLGKVTTSTTIRRTGTSCKYFRIGVNCFVRDFFSITNFDTEHYLRFVRRLR